jgi:divalent metal cation (Fe/Co/Zn/Cd) transporter
LGREKGAGRMNQFTVILVVLAIFVTMAGIIYSLVKKIREIKKDRERLENELVSVKANLTSMTVYIQKILAIKNDTQSNVEKIKEAKTDEEVLNILSDIISANNNRVQND